MTDPPDREIAVFSAARRLPASERAAYLDEACAGDATLRQRVESLLRAGQEAGVFLQAPAPGAHHPADASALATLKDTTPGEKAGDRIGHYKLLQQIGEGGCGVVYMAEQEEPVRRRVALKVIKLGMDTKSVIGRFEAERQALALMDHPNIAKVLEAGATDAGRPYFVMELVRGVKITEYCDQNNLSTKERLEIFIQVCHAVQHAHQKGIIHRDIKPSNILVASNDGVPVPKVIDFGIAKATQGRLTDQTIFTAFEQFIGTPAYMSPEQAELTMFDVDTRTDIYSLGVLLYELLIGRTPFETKDLLAAGLDAMRRTIREQEPERPSTRLSTMAADALTTTAKHRQTDAPRLLHLISGDLDWIVMKALEKDRKRRYETANSLASDVRRHLNCEPVIARPPSRLYEFQKTVRRHKFGFAATGAVMVALMLGLTVSTWEYLQERKARQRAVAAELERAKSLHRAELMNRFLTEDLLFQATPEQNARGKQVTMEEVLEKATLRLGKNAEIGQNPEVEATLRLDFGMTWAKLSVLDQAGSNLRRAVNLRRSLFGPENRETLEAEHQLASFLIHGLTELKEGEKLAFEVWQAREQLLGATNRHTLRSRELYCDALLDGGKSPEAMPIVRKTLEIRERFLGTNDYDTISSLGEIGQALTGVGAYGEARPFFREALKRFERGGWADQLESLICCKELALASLIEGDPAEADKLLREMIPRAERILGTNTTYTLQFQRIRVRALAEQDLFPEAEALAVSNLAARRSQTSDVRGDAYTLLYYGRVLVQQGTKEKLDEAEPHLKEALRLFREHLPGRLDLAVQAANWMGTILVARKNFTDAEDLMLPASAQFTAPAAEMSLNERRLGIRQMINLYKAWGDKPEQAALWEEKLKKAAALSPMNSSR